MTESWPVVVVGAGPSGLMLAAELCLSGVAVLVLDRKPAIHQTPKANGIGGRIRDLLRYRGIWDRLEAASPEPEPAARFPFGGLHVDLSELTDPPLRGLPLPQPELERVLAERATELGAQVRRGHELLALDQDADSVTAAVRGPGGEYRVRAQYLIGCDGARSRVRELLEIPFPGTTYPEVNRLGQVSLPAGVTQLDNGDFELAGGQRIPWGFTRTERGVFAISALRPGELMIFTTEEEPGEIDNDEPMPLTELQDSVRRVLGVELPVGEPIRLSRWQFQARQAQRYRDGRVLLAGDAAHLLPATGAAINLGMLDAVNLAWKLGAQLQGRAPEGLLDSYDRERRIASERALLQTQAQVALRRGADPAAEALRAVLAELLQDEQAARRLGAHIAGADLRYPAEGGHPLSGTFVPDLALSTEQGASSVAELLPSARPVLLELAGRAELREIAREWPGIEVRTATTEDRPADALLIRPDAHIAWAAAVGEDGESAARGLRAALETWFGAAVPVAG